MKHLNFFIELTSLLSGIILAKFGTHMNSFRKMQTPSFAHADPSADSARKAMTLMDVTSSIAGRSQGGGIRAHIKPC